VSPARATLLVAERELRETMRRKTFWIVLAILFLGSTAAVVVPEIVGDDGPTTYHVAVAGEAGSFGRAITALGPALDAEIEVVAVDDAAAARDQVDGDHAAVAVVLPADDTASPTVIVRAGQHQRLVGAISQALAAASLDQRLGDAGLTDDQIADALAAPAPVLDELDTESESRRGASFALSLVLYLLLLTVMIQVANAIAIEKANRISEVLLAIVRPGPLMFGKVIGVGVSGIAALLITLTPVVAKLLVGGDLPDGIGGALAGSAVWFALGLVLYLLIAASLGALVERQEEAGAAVAPLTAILVGTFVVSGSGAESTLGAVLAWIPLTSPLVEPTRIAVGASSTVEVIGSIALLVVTIVVAARVGATVYARGIVHTGKRLKLREVLRRPSA
jgi:ABC-2 type transport system permease protein